jgi:hypothetical protein
MKNILFVDNFRGFSNTFIPIEDVNFFVGENSTGKTSILSLISLLGSFDFQFNQKFNTQEVKFGTFKDIYSGPKNDKHPSFKIGYILQSKDSICEAALFTYCEYENNPELVKFNAITKHGEINVLLDKTPVKKRIIDIDPKKLDFENIYKEFRNWLIQPDDINAFQSINKRHIDTKPFLFFIHSLFSDNAKGNLPIEEVFPLKILAPDFTEGVVWIAPIRSKPKKTYDEYKLDFDSEGEHTPYLIKSLLKKSKTSNNFNQFIEVFGKESGLFDSLAIKGYGRDLSSPFELRVVLDDLPLSLVNVGYGVSQALPIIVELFNRPKGSKFAIQQPEVHLHPKAQAALGEVIFDLAFNSKKGFYIETHSDYTIDRFRIKMREKSSEVRFSSQVLFFSRGQEGNKIQPISIMKNGSYSEDQPAEFREFFLNESLNLLGL